MKLRTGSPSGVSLVLALTFALFETVAHLSTDEFHRARAPSRSSSSDSIGARR